MEKRVLLNLIGTSPSETAEKKKIRFHQGWWRAFVLNRPQGLNPARASENVCNTVLDGETNSKNILTDAALLSIKQTKIEREKFKAGLFNENRLFNNLLSSQPLAFNFFGILKQDLDLARKFTDCFIPGVTKVTNVFFEFAPSEKYTGDNSAFDVAIEFEKSGLKGLWGIECKYTDSFSPTAHDKQTYKNTYAASKNFLASYVDCISSRFNQLFRNQLIGEALLQNSKYDFVYTGLFCYQGDSDAIETGRQFQRMLTDGSARFIILTYADFLTAMQKLDLSWEQREETMMLWARYCGLTLSAQCYDTCY